MEHVRQAHEAVIALHGIPVQGNGVLVVVALVFRGEETRCDAPAVAGTDSAALMHILAVERLAGEPGVARRLRHGAGLLIHSLPSFLSFYGAMFDRYAERVELAWDEERLWRTDTMLTDLESVFRSLTSELGLRPIYHHKEVRSDAPTLPALQALLCR